LRAILFENEIGINKTGINYNSSHPRKNLYQSLLIVSAICTLIKAPPYPTAQECDATKAAACIAAETQKFLQSFPTPQSSFTTFHTAVA